MTEAAAHTDLSVIIVNWNTQALLRDCLGSVREHLSDVDHEVIVVDNDSSDGSADMVEREFFATRLIRNNDNVGFGRANNQAMRVARGRWFLLLNSDTMLLDQSVGRLLDRLRDDPDVGVAHCRLVFPDGRTQHTVYRFPSIRLALLEDLGFYKLLPARTAGPELLSGYWSYDEERDVDWVAGAFMLLRREIFDAIGGFDERLFMYGEDLEWCYRIRDLGWRIRFYPGATVMHRDHSSAEIKWGEERIALCMVTQRDVYRRRHSTGQAALLMALRASGAALRTAYYTARSRLGGPRAAAYEDMRAYTARAFRALLPLVLPRR